MIDLLINISGGLINSKRQAQIVLVIITIVAASITLFIVFTRSRTLFRKRNTEVQFVPGQEEYYRSVQPFE